MKTNVVADPGVVPPLAWVLSNGRYHVVISESGGGESRWQGLALNRWRGDPVEDCEGYFVYLRDLEDGRFWSVGNRPVKPRDGRCGAAYSAGCVSLTREEHEIVTHLDVTVSPHDDVEVRRMRIRNASQRRRRIEITTCIEVVLNYPMADAGHPAFSKLFVQTELVGDRAALLAHRRPRSSEESWPPMVHALVGAPTIQYETDRLRFIGRGRTVAQPAVLAGGAQLSGAVGNVLDPVMSLRTILEIDAGATAEVSFVLAVAADRAAVLSLAGRYRDGESIQRLFADAAQAEKALCRRLGISAQQENQFQALAGGVLYGRRDLRPANVTLRRDSDVDGAFARCRIPPDRPLVLATVGWESPHAQQLLLARRYWDAKGIATNLVVVSDSTVAQPAGLDDRVFTFKTSALAAGDVDALLAAARLVVTGALPKLKGAGRTRARAARTSAARSAVAAPAAGGASGEENLQLFNGYGGFTADGREYVIRLPWQKTELTFPPQPWINVIANERCGLLVSESGAGYTWSRNSQANRLTPWFNDPVTDPHGEAFYVRDDVTGSFWSPLPGPAPAACPYEARHGFGYSRFRCVHEDLEQEATVFVPRSDPVRIVRLRITNRGTGDRHVSLFSYQRLLLGSMPESPSMIVTDHDQHGGTLHAGNVRGNEFRGGISFASTMVTGATVESRYFTCDRMAFIGRNRSLTCPAALSPGANLNGVSGAGWDPCFAQQVRVTLAAGRTLEVIFLLGECLSEGDIPTVVARYGDAGAAERALEEVKEFWHSLLTTVQIATPVPAIDLMLNGWLLYQVLACRIWGRSAFYQSGGAYGYRDQLQDAATLVHVRPEATRAQLLLHAAHQFVEGDVLHWWHPQPLERGLRTHFSDDLLWLPYVTSYYVKVTGDYSVLDETAGFVSARLLGEDEDEAYLKPEVARESATVYEHCCRALDRSLTSGAHGLPLMGTGDWNDGMNRVGRKGRGESVWLGFFLHHILDEFLPLCERCGDQARVARYGSYRTQLAAALNDNAWDGAWYRRAYYDDGTPLGTVNSDECRIDAIAQAWAIISNVAPRERAEHVIQALEAHLISDHDGIIKLLTPPFVNTPHDPGYIKGYIAGVRENGGQYTHGACWVVRAFAEAGARNRAAQLLERLSPVWHASSLARTDRYKVEPYIIAADIYGEPPHIGRGGWTWYTGSAGWMYRIALESVLGFGVDRGETLTLCPRVSDAWSGYRITYRRPDGKTTYEIEVKNPHGGADHIVTLEVDGQASESQPNEARIPLAADGRVHRVVVTLG